MKMDLTSQDTYAHNIGSSCINQSVEDEEHTVLSPSILQYT
jgi:hypothetical protein